MQNDVGDGLHEKKDATLLKYRLTSATLQKKTMHRLREKDGEQEIKENINATKQMKAFFLAVIGVCGNNVRSPLQFLNAKKTFDFHGHRHSFY